MRLIATLYCLLSLSFLLSQNPPDTLWTKTFGQDNNDAATCVRSTSDGGLIIIGTTDPLGNGMNDIWLIKTDEAGNLLWEETYGGYNNDCSFIGQQVSDGGYIIVGFTESFGNGGRDFWLVKTDENGIEEWNQTYGTPENDRAQYVEETSDGGFIITGGTGNFESDNQDFWLIKTNAIGEVEWDQTYGGNGNEKAYTVHQESDGCFILAGYTTSFGNGGFDVWLLKTDGSGNEIWNRTFGGNERENAYSLQICPDGGYIIAGVTRSFGEGEDDVWLIKTDSLGMEEWNETYGTEFVDYCYSVDVTYDGNYILGSFTNSTANSDFDVLAMKIDTYGNELWSVKIGGNANDYSFYIEQTEDEGCILAGRSNSFGNGDDDIYLVKLSEDEVGSDHDLEEPSGLKLWNYPNPFNPTTTISFELTTENTESTDLVIYNIKGQKVKQYSIFNIQSSIYWNGTDNNNQPVSSGVYYYKLNTLDSPISKMLLIK